ncbi:hypothetical protein PMAYCL1PPCAC_07901, partial [Pristionchus mayeri]
TVINIALICAIVALIVAVIIPVICCYFGCLCTCCCYSATENYVVEQEKRGTAVLYSVKSTRSKTFTQSKSMEGGEQGHEK